jgi:Fur family iron response transcriptional regulator
MRRGCQPRKVESRIEVMGRPKRQFAESTKSGAKLRAAGLRPTRQRLRLAELLFRHGNRHVTAELLHQEAQDAGCAVSLATVYNTLHQFTTAGLLQQVIVDPSRSYFDTNTGSHQHFYDEEDGGLIDIAADAVEVSGLPAPPRGKAIARVDVVVRIRRA